MSQYYRPLRAAYSSVTSEDRHRVPSLGDVPHRCGSDAHVDDTLASSSILVFPNAPSEQETSRTESHFELTGSMPSFPSDMSIDSLRSRSRSRNGESQHGNERGWCNIPRTFPRDWDEVPEEGWELELNGEGSGRNWDNIRYTYHRPMQSHASSPLPGLNSLAPQLPFRLPLISCLRSILNVDESTLHLISRSPDPHTSALFPFPPSSSPPSYDDTVNEPVHGAHKLLIHNPDKSKNSALLKAGMDTSDLPADANPFLVSPAQIPIWRFVEFVFEGGVRMWREVRVWHTSGERRVDV